MSRRQAIGFAAGCASIGMYVGWALYRRSIDGRYP